MTFHIVTIFPNIFDSYFQESIIYRAQKDKKVDIKIYDLRVYANDKHKTVDDTQYGGGPGMVLKVDSIWRCVEFIKSRISASSSLSGDKLANGKSRESKLLVLLTSAKGNEYTQRKAKKLKCYTDIIIICGRYEGVDERVAQKIADEEISIGKYILTGGEIPAMVIVDSVARLIPGVLGNEDSLLSESHDKQGIIDHPVYTRPSNFQGWEVPAELLSGNHKIIKQWREDKRK